MVADDEHVMFTARVTAAHHGRSLDVVNAYVFRFQDGKLAAGQVFPGDLHAVEAFFARIPKPAVSVLRGSKDSRDSNVGLRFSIRLAAFLRRVVFV